MALVGVDDGQGAGDGFAEVMSRDEKILVSPKLPRLKFDVPKRISWFRSDFCATRTFSSVLRRRRLRSSVLVAIRVPSSDRQVGLRGHFCSCSIGRSA